MSTLAWAVIIVVIVVAALAADAKNIQGSK